MSRPILALSLAGLLLACAALALWRGHGVPRVIAAGAALGALLTLFG